MTFSVILWGNSYGNSKMFHLQKKVVRIVAGAQKKESCRKLFEKFHILPLANEYLLVPVIYITDKFRNISDKL
jgi:hypothetical protein